MILSGKKILLGVTGSVAIYKAVELIRLLRERGAVIQVVMTKAAKEFIQPLLFEAISGTSLPDATTSSDSGIRHIDLSRWADITLIAPLSANTLTKLAIGLADNELTEICFAFEGRLYLAPAMNRYMWEHPATQANINTLRDRGAYILGPGYGCQACGDTGYGCLLEPSEIIQHLEKIQDTSQALLGYRVIVTAGPTVEPIDPVRFISNRSSGKMGYAIASAALAAGADVLLISGPTALTPPVGVRYLSIETAADLLNITMQHIAECDLFISVAAIADYSVAVPAIQKIKKNEHSLELMLVRNPDILSCVSALEKKPFIVGFAAETENLIQNAKKKLIEKKMDLIVANLVGDCIGFSQEENAFTVILPSMETIAFPKAAKRQLAQQLIELIATISLDPHGHTQEASLQNGDSPIPSDLHQKAPS